MTCYGRRRPAKTEQRALQVLAVKNGDVAEAGRASREGRAGGEGGGPEDTAVLASGTASARSGVAVIPYRAARSRAVQVGTCKEGQSSL